MNQIYSKLFCTLGHDQVSQKVCAKYYYYYYLSLYFSGGLDSAEPWQGTWERGVLVQCDDGPKTVELSSPAVPARREPPRRQQQKPGQNPGDETAEENREFRKNKS